jgi:hypothetical protein
VTQYIEILAEQEPFDFAEDENRRVMFSFNLSMIAIAPAADVEQEVAKVLTTAGLFALGTTGTIGRTAVIPSGAGPIVSIIKTAGPRSDYTHDQAGAAHERPACQIVVRGRDYEATRTRARACWRALDGKRDTTIAA